MAGAYDVVIAAGVENMTRVPMGASFLPGSTPFGPKVLERYDLVPQGISAELIAEKWGITREENDAFSVESHRRAARATEEGRFEREIVPIPVTTDDGHARSFDARRGHPPRLVARDARQAQARVQARRRDHRRQLVADHRRRRGDADHERGEGRPSSA